MMTRVCGWFFRTHRKKIHAADLRQNDIDQSQVRFELRRHRHGLMTGSRRADIIASGF